MSANKAKSSALPKLHPRGQLLVTNSIKLPGTRPISARVFSCVFELFYVVNYMFSCFDGGVGLGGGGGY